MITGVEGGVFIDLHVQPNAHRPGVRGIHGQRLKVAVSAPAESGKANEAALAAIADLLRVRRRAVSLVAGSTTRRKRVHVDGVDPATAHELIKTAIGD
ncbi:MAG: DUF167 family protein [Acidimicrobiia bacterium]